MRSRIAIFEGYGVPKKHRRKSRRTPVSMGFDPRELPPSYGAPLFNNPRVQGYGGPIFNNPGMQGYGAPLFNNPGMQGYGRRGYYVPPVYGPASGPSGRKTNRKGYKVKKRRNSKAQVKFKKAAKHCAKRRSGSFQICMRKQLKKGRKSRR